MREAKNNKELRWLVIGDDDTLFGVSKLANLIGCYDDDDDGGDNWPVVLGERYGRFYAVHNRRGKPLGSSIKKL